MPFGVFVTIKGKVRNTVTCRVDVVSVRIYINGILHLRIPRDPLTKIQSWIDSAAKTWVVEIWCAGHSDQMVYDDPILWQSVLSALDTNV